MNIKSIIALFMGLVIQFSQAQPCLTAAPAKSCVENESSSCCCGDFQSCPCVSESPPDQKPAPLIPGAVDLKPLISKAPEPCGSETLASPPPTAALPAATLLERRSGYTGVPLSVAFCRFII